MTCGLCGMPNYDSILLRPTPCLCNKINEDGEEIGGLAICDPEDDGYNGEVET